MKQGCLRVSMNWWKIWQKNHWMSSTFILDKSCTCQLSLWLFSSVAHEHVNEPLSRQSKTSVYFILFLSFSAPWCLREVLSFSSSFWPSLVKKRLAITSRESTSCALADHNRHDTVTFITCNSPHFVTLLHLQYTVALAVHCCGSKSSWLWRANQMVWSRLARFDPESTTEGRAGPVQSALTSRTMLVHMSIGGTNARNSHCAERVVRTANLPGTGHFRRWDLEVRFPTLKFIFPARWCEPGTSFSDNGTWLWFFCTTTAFSGLQLDADFIDPKEKKRRVVGTLS